MMNKIQNIFILTAVLVFSLNLGVQAQTESAYRKAAEKALESADHYSALVYYKNLLEFDEENTEYLSKAGDAAKKMNAYSTAEKYYKKLMELDEDGKYPMTSLNLADVQKNLGKYDTAQMNYSIFKSEYNGDDQNLLAAVDQELDYTRWAKDAAAVEWKEFEIEHLSNNINTPYSEFGAIELGDSLMYSSLRFDNKEDAYDPNRPLAGVLVSENLGNGKELGEGVNVDGRHTAHTVFNKDQSRMYYTLCSYYKSDSIICDIYFRDRGADGNYGPSQEPAGINASGFTTTQPNVGIDEMGNEYLYFASNRTGGEGKLDVYRAKINAGGFGEPENLRKINTAGNEATPFYDGNAHALYFSSDGHQGFGGYDVFKSYMKDGRLNDVVHLGQPLNTSYNDVYYYLAGEDGDQAYLSSNRPPSIYLDEEFEACCYDIYRVKINPFANLIAQTFDATTSDSLYGTTIRLIDVTGDPFELTLQDDDLASGVFPLDRDRDYILIGDKQDYVSDTVFFNTKNVKTLEDMVKKLYLMPDELDLDVFTFDDRTKEALRGATVQIIDLTDPSMEPITITNFDANDFHAKVLRGHEYRIIASRKGYSTETVLLDTKDYAGKKSIKLDMFLKIGDLEDFLPLVVYFDNDKPNEDTWLRKTDVNYTETYPPYYSRKNTFKSRYSAPLNGSEKITAENILENFFETEVKKGYEDLNTFLMVLAGHLRNGRQVTISIKGYCSPKASSPYNIALGKRRISSVENDIAEYGGGILQKYLDTKQLKIEQNKSFGETTAPRGISASHSDERNSIYSYEASKERRVEIVKVSLSN